MEARLLFTVKGQVMTRDDRWKIIASESKNYLKARFAFEDGPWIPEETTAVFYSPREVVAKVKLDSNGECLVPNEVLTAPGNLEVSLVYSTGETETEIRVTTSPVECFINPTLKVLHSGGES